jgi:type III restriction enzyme
VAFEELCPYVKLISVAQDGGFSARLEIDKANKDGVVERKIVTAKPHSELFTLSGDRNVYKDYAVAEIECEEGREYIKFANGDYLYLGKSQGDIDENLLKKAQIRRTIEEHFDKELALTERGIKVLSLFFIDEVGKYRAIDGEKGIYATMFEECYEELCALPKYELIKNKFDSNCHDGYFSQDKKGVPKNTKGDSNDDFDTYSLIMKDKEKLLSFSCPLRFIFSHSALKEGWDNPNVFQVCTLIDQKSMFTCRQKIGRGLRLCVDQNGERIEDKEINQLHVIANESFAEFAENLQKEIENESGVKFGVIDVGLFEGLLIPKIEVVETKITEAQSEQIVVALNKAKNEGLKIEEATLPTELEPIKEVIIAKAKTAEIAEVQAFTDVTVVREVKTETPATAEEITEIVAHLEKKEYITKAGKMKDTLKTALLTDTLDLPAKFEAAKERLISRIKTADKKVPIVDANKKVVVKMKENVLESPLFKELWSKINGKTKFRVTVDEDEFVAKIVAQLQQEPEIRRAHIVTKTANLDVEREGISFSGEYSQTLEVENIRYKIAAVTETIREECSIRRALFTRILRESGRVGDFLNNPQAFVEKFIEIANRVREKLEIDGVKYERIVGAEFYAQDVFERKELATSLDFNVLALRNKNSVYDHVVCDSKTVEMPFAEALDDDKEVKLFFKIPPKFRIDTPIGTYNPDWAIHLEKNGEEKMYFVIETKGTTIFDDLANPEGRKIRCGVKHFEALGAEVVFPKEPVKAWREFKGSV